MCKEDCFPEDDMIDPDMDYYDYEDELLDYDDFWDAFPEEGDWEAEEDELDCEWRLE